MKYTGRCQNDVNVQGYSRPHPQTPRRCAYLRRRGSAAAASRARRGSCRSAAGARQVLGWPSRCELARAFLWEYSDNRLRLVQLLGRHGDFLTCPGRKPSFWAVERHVCPYKSDIENQFNMKTLRALNHHGQARTLWLSNEKKPPSPSILTDPSATTAL